MTHSDMSVRARGSKLVGNRTLRSTRESSLKVARVDWFCFVPANLESLDDHCSKTSVRCDIRPSIRLGCIVSQIVDIIW